MTTKPEPIEQVIARSSVGGYAWCANCQHPDLVHAALSPSPYSEHRGDCSQCSCSELRRMSPREWLEWKHPDIAGSSQP